MPEDTPAPSADGNDDGPPAFHDRCRRVRCPQVDADHSRHFRLSFAPVLPRAGRSCTNAAPAEPSWSLRELPDCHAVTFSLEKKYGGRFQKSSFAGARPAAEAFLYAPRHGAHRIPPGLPLGRGHGRLPDRGFPPGRRGMPFQLAPFLPPQGQRSPTGPRATWPAITTTGMPGDIDAHARAGAAGVQVLDRVVADHSRTGPGQPQGARFLREGWSTQSSRPASLLLQRSSIGISPRGSRTGAALPGASPSMPFSSTARPCFARWATG